MKGPPEPEPLASEPLQLHLAPRWHANETLSSWLNRLASAYSMTDEEFLQWLGVERSRLRSAAFQDLDARLPPDVAVALERHTRIGRSRLQSERLDGDTILPRGLRYAVCPHCAQEKTARRDREWADAWSLICWEHRCFLTTTDRGGSTRGPDGAVAAAEPFTRICTALGVDERSEFLHVYYWLASLHRLAILHGGATMGTPGPFQAASAYANRNLQGQETAQDHWRVQRDLVIFFLIKFRSPSVLQTLDPSIREGQLIHAAHEPDACGLVLPRANYFVRLFAAVLALHLWERMLCGRWRAGRANKIVPVLNNSDRWSDEDWWLERRLHSWTPRLQRLGREVFGKQSGWTQLPPWLPCRETCARRLHRGPPDLLVTRLPPDWRCRWEEGSERSYAPEVYVTDRVGRRSDPYYWVGPSKRPPPR